MTPTAFLGSDLGVGLRLCELNLEIKHFGWRLLLLLLQLCRSFLLTGQLSVHILQQVPRDDHKRTRDMLLDATMRSARTCRWAVSSRYFLMVCW